MHFISVYIYPHLEIVISLILWQKNYLLWHDASAISRPNNVGYSRDVADFSIACWEIIQGMCFRRMSPKWSKRHLKPRSMAIVTGQLCNRPWRKTSTRISWPVIQNPIIIIWTNSCATLDLATPAGRASRSLTCAATPNYELESRSTSAVRNK
jgi:hypothetical protein